MTSNKTVPLDNIAAAEKIFEQYGSFIYSVIRYKITDQFLVDDLFQDFFLTLAANPVTLEGPKLKAFLYRAIINDIRDAFRCRQRYKNLLKKHVKNCDFTINKQGVKNAYSIEEKVENITKNAWEQLSPKETTAISLRYFDGYSIAEVAEKMQIKPGSVSRYICVGLGKMRQSLNLNSGG